MYLFFLSLIPPAPLNPPPNKGIGGIVIIEPGVFGVDGGEIVGIEGTDGGESVDPGLLGVLGGNNDGGVIDGVEGTLGGDLTTVDEGGDIEGTLGTKTDEKDGGELGKLGIEIDGMLDNNGDAEDDGVLGVDFNTDGEIDGDTNLLNELSTTLFNSLGVATDGFPTDNEDPINNDGDDTILFPIIP